VGRYVAPQGTDFLKPLTPKKSENNTVLQDFCPHSTSVTQIGSEEPICATASPREKLLRRKAARGP
jgi:hypothetical protein